MLPENIPPINLLDQSQRTWLVARSHPISLPKGARVYMAGDREDEVCLLISGLIKTGGISIESHEYVLQFVTPGEYFGEAGLFGDVPPDEFAEAVEPSVVIAFATQAMRRMMDNVPTFGYEMMQLFYLRQSRKEKRLKELLFASNKDRLIHVLLDLGEQFGSACSDGVQLNIHLSHQELASMIGCVRETVSLALCSLRDEGLLQIGRRELILTGVKELAAKVGRKYN